MAKKRYNLNDRLKFHKNRVNNPNISEGKRIYSRHWLDGFTDSHAKNNYSAICCEIDRKKGRCSRTESIVLHGYKNGLKANLDSRK